MDFEKAFENVDGEIDKSLFALCKTICTEYSIDADALASKWDALKYATKASDEVTRAQLDSIRATMKSKAEKQQSRRLSAGSGGLGGLPQGLSQQAPVRKSILNKHSFMDRAVSADPFAHAFGVSMGTTPAESPSDKGSRKRSLGAAAVTPITRKRMSILSPSVEPSPPSSKAFDARDDQGEVLVSFNGSEVARGEAPENVDKTRRVRVNVITSGDASARFMFEDEEDKRDGLNERLEHLMASVNQAHEASLPPAPVPAVKAEGGVDEEQQDKEDDRALAYAPVGIPNQEAVVVGGRVTGEGSLTATTTMLMGDKSISDNRQVKLRLGLLKEYAFFPGQVLGIKGVNNSGTGMVVEDVLHPALLPPSAFTGKELRRMNEGLKGQPLTMMMAAGPFTSPIDLAFAPLNDLMKKVKEDKPDVLLLMGPFLDESHPDVKNGKMELTYGQFFVDLLLNLLENTKELGTKVLVAPSPKDVCFDNILPQLPLDLSKELKSERLTMLPNPATFSINDVTFGMANLDILLRLGKLELGKGQQGDRIKRLASHLLTQHSYLPMFPPPSSDNVDFTHYDQLHFPGVTPDVLILPSKMKYFAHEIDHGVLCINPASLTKGVSGGTYAHITVHPRKDEEMPEGENTQTSSHFLPSRTRVDIARI